MALATTIPVLTALSNTLLDPLKKHIGYAFELEGKIDSFSAAIASLQIEQDAVQRSVLAARKRGETVHEIVIKWQTRVEDAIAYGEKLIRKAESMKSSCFLNFKARYQVGKRLERKEPVIRSYIKDKSRFANDISVCPEPDQVVERNVEGHEAKATTSVGQHQAPAHQLEDGDPNQGDQTNKASNRDKQTYAAIKEKEEGRIGRQSERSISRGKKSKQSKRERKESRKQLKQYQRIHHQLDSD